VSGASQALGSVAAIGDTAAGSRRPDLGSLQPGRRCSRRHQRHRRRAAGAGRRCRRGSGDAPGSAARP
jgi:hypothetical protein